MLVLNAGQQAWILCALTCAAAPAMANSTADQSGEPASATRERASRPSDEPVPSCLDQSIVDELGQSLRPRGVQKREFLKKGQLQILGRGGLFAGDLMSSSYVYGGAIGWYITEDLGFEGSFEVTDVALDIDKPLAEFTGDDSFEGGLGFLVLGGVNWTPIHAKLKMAGTIVHADLGVHAGAGRMLHDSAQGIAFDGGVLLDLFVSQWITLRFDLRNLVMVQEAVGETRLGNNLIITGGLGLWLPTGW